jgi:hypothetical protein
MVHASLKLHTFNLNDISDRYFLEINLNFLQAAQNFAVYKNQVPEPTIITFFDNRLISE